MLEITEQLRNLEAQWNATYLAGDVAGFAALLDDDFVYSSERGVFRKEAYVANLASGVIEMRRLETVHSEISLHGNVAVSIGIVVMEANFRGQDISGQDRFTRVWLNKDSKWKAIAQHANVKAD